MFTHLADLAAFQQWFNSTAQVVGSAQIVLGAALTIITGYLANKARVAVRSAKSEEIAIIERQKHYLQDEKQAVVDDIMKLNGVRFGQLQKDIRSLVGRVNDLEQENEYLRDKLELSDRKNAALSRRVRVLEDELAAHNLPVPIIQESV